MESYYIAYDGMIRKVYYHPGGWTPLLYERHRFATLEDVIPTFLRFCTYLAYDKLSVEDQYGQVVLHGSLFPPPQGSSLRKIIDEFKNTGSSSAA